VAIPFIGMVRDRLSFVLTNLATMIQAFASSVAQSGEFQMSKISDIARLVLTTELSDQSIASSLSVARNTVRRYRKLALQREYSWDALAKFDTLALDAAFNVRAQRLPRKRMPDFAKVHAELQRVGVTLQLLWEEYRGPSPMDALSYSQFTFHHRLYTKSQKLSMRQVHVPGERAFVDFSGKRPSYINQMTGELIPVELFVGALGYSHLIYARALATQTSGDWITANVQMLEFFGGKPKIIVPDNLRSAVTRPGVQPIINRAYQDFARHYEVVILPARPYKPKDKSKVEIAVQIAQRWILARIRNHTFFSLAELNAEIARLVTDLNNRPFKHLPGCRRSCFDEHEKALLRALPTERFELAEWTGVQTVGPDYHMCIDEHWYSVSYKLVGEKIEARKTSATVEIYHRGRRVASHLRGDKGGHTTLPEHQLPQHRAYAERTPERYIAWAEKIGNSMLAVVKHQFDRSVPLFGLSACDALKRLARQYGVEQLESAARRAIEIKSPTVKSVRSLLSTGRHLHAEEALRQIELPLHHNVRGPDYYARGGSQSC
jgi:transposase